MDDIKHESERLILRTYRLSDFEDHYMLRADPNADEGHHDGDGFDGLRETPNVAEFVGFTISFLEAREEL